MQCLLWKSQFGSTPELGVEQQQVDHHCTCPLLSSPPCQRRGTPPARGRVPPPPLDAPPSTPPSACPATSGPLLHCDTPSTRTHNRQQLEREGGKRPHVRPRHLRRSHAPPQIGTWPRRDRRSPCSPPPAPPVRCTLGRSHCDRRQLPGQEEGNQRA